MSRTYDYEKKPSQSTTSVKPTASFLQTRDFAPLQTDLDEDVTFRPSGYSENFLEKIINQRGTESSDTPIQAKPMNRLKAISSQRMAIQAKQNYESSAESTTASIHEKPQNRLKALQSERMAIQAKLSIGEPNDKYEQEADATASRVVQQINSPAQDQSVQREGAMEEDDEELQMKPISSIQRGAMPEDEEELQMKPDSIQRKHASNEKINRLPSNESEETDVTAEIGEARQTNPLSIHPTNAPIPKINRTIEVDSFSADPRVSQVKSQSSAIDVNRKVNRQADTVDTSDFDIQTIQRMPQITPAPQSTIQRDDTTGVEPSKNKAPNFLAGSLYNKNPELPRWDKNHNAALDKWKAVADKDLADGNIDQAKHNLAMANYAKLKKDVKDSPSLKIGEGVRSFVLETFCGPFMYISEYRRKKFTDSFSENKAIYSDMGSESVDKTEPHGVLRFLANSEKVISEVGKIIGWIGLVCGISSFIAAAIPYGQPAAAVLAAIATVCGLTTAGIALVRLILNTILAVSNLGFHTKAMAGSPPDVAVANNARKQTYKHLAQAISNIISLASAGAGLGITFGAGSGINLDTTLSSSSAQAAATATGPKVASVLSTTARGVPLGGIGKGVEEGIKQIGKEKHDLVPPPVAASQTVVAPPQTLPTPPQSVAPSLNNSQSSLTSSQSSLGASQTVVAPPQTLPTPPQSVAPSLNNSQSSLTSSQSSLGASQTVVAPPQTLPTPPQSVAPSLNNSQSSLTSSQSSLGASQTVVAPPQTLAPPVQAQPPVRPRMGRSRSAPELGELRLKPANDLFLQRTPDEAQEAEKAAALASAKTEAQQIIQDNVKGTLDSGRDASNTEQSNIGQADQNLATGATNLNQLVKPTSDIDKSADTIDAEAQKGETSLDVDVKSSISKDKLKNESGAESERSKIEQLDEKLTEAETAGGIAKDEEKPTFKQKLKNLFKSGWKSVKSFFLKAYGNLKARLKKIFAAIQIKIAQMVVKFAGLTEPVQALQAGVGSAKANVAPARDSIADSLASNQETGVASDQLLAALAAYKG
ncbi:hypothetical protein APA_1179 [Pseudanabaena sp. lw0831]|uniref:hypothetical protein n=1 Tax=Pseudanabaena sp. lw0831 TaxID=1357935 RepID=UPI00191631DB|nr:hypothetical protein [Pseudanabaena sp. lw0831]GBO53272.1 hypothetical protein APA_1179 [Pseudanabaena sp. lw0831]